MIVKFSGKIRVYQGKAVWFFINLPEDESAQIKFLSSWRGRRGFGAVPVVAKIGKSEWRTSIFPDSKIGAYILPLKADIRKKEKISAEDEVELELDVSV